MNLSHTVTVAAPLARVWALLDDLESVIPCLPGATFLRRDGDTYEAGIKVKVGVIAMNFVGAARIVERDEIARRVTIQGSGKDTKGKGAANATVVASLTSVDAGHTAVALDTALALSGRIAQFGGSIINEIASRLIEQFVANLNSAILAGAAPDAETLAAGYPSDGDAAARVSGPDGIAPAVPAGPATATEAPVPAASPESVPHGPAAGKRVAPAIAEPAPLDLGALMRPVVARLALRALAIVAIFALGFLAGRYL